MSEDEYEEVVEVSFSELLKGIPPTGDSYFMHPFSSNWDYWLSQPGYAP
jgi:hypothetical protein